jgi:hypothetical protein
MRRWTGNAIDKLNLLLCAALASASAAAQVAVQTPACGTPAAVLHRYIDAVGGDVAVGQLKSLAIEARAVAPHTFNPEATAHYTYALKWQAPNRVAVHWQYLLSPGTGLFDGAHWSNFDGRISHNDDATPRSHLEMRARYPYNDSPQWMMYRITANPILLATDKGLYTRFENLSGLPATCVLRAYGETEWKTERRDQLTFDATTGLLQSWKIQAGVPDQISYVEFRFDDYRQAGSVKIPFSMYFDFYKTTLTVTGVLLNPRLTEAQFAPKSR